MNIYVGNFSQDVTGDDLMEAFGSFGHVLTAKVIRDKFSGESRGFGFVEMPNNNEAQAALRGVIEIKGRKITINEARPQMNANMFGGKKGRPHGGGYSGRRERRR